jgi:hypothetical protein
MARYVLTADVALAFASYAAPGRAHKKGQVVELSAAEVTAIGAGNVLATSVRDATGESTAVSN